MKTLEVLTIPNIEKIPQSVIDVLEKYNLLQNVIDIKITNAQNKVIIFEIGTVFTKLDLPHIVNLDSFKGITNNNNNLTIYFE